MDLIIHFTAGYLTVSKPMEPAGMLWHVFVSTGIQLVNADHTVPCQYGRYGSEVPDRSYGSGGGHSWDQAATSKSFLEDIMAKTRSLPGNKGLGVLYWEPEAYGNWQGYTLGAFDNSGRPTVALQAFKN